MYVCTECVLGFGDVRMHIPKLLCGVKTIGHLCDFPWDISVLPVSVEVLAGFNGMPPLSEKALSLLNLVAHKASWDSTPFRLMNLTADLAGFNGMPPLSEQALSLLNLVAHKTSWDSTPFRLMNLTADLLCAIGVCDN